jgi:two-component system, sensor histidine kinase RegB
VSLETAASSTFQHSLPWLVRVRWIAIVGQGGALLIAQRTLATPIEWPWAIAALATVGVSNLVLQRLIQARQNATPNDEFWERVTGLVLLFDTLALTAVLWSAGGKTNPFTILYIVHIVLAALVLNTRWTGWVTLLSALAFGSLFVLPAGEIASHSPHMHNSYSDHLSGMWLAFAVAATIVAYFVRQISLTLQRQREQIEGLRDRAMHARHLAGLTTLAGGAAHELRTPLGTIAVAVHELKRQLLGAPSQGSEQTASDLSLIEAEVERCQDILSAMGPRFDARRSKNPQASANDIVRLVLSRFEEDRAKIETHTLDPDARVACSPDEAASALGRVMSNALRAAGKTQVVFSLLSDSERVHFCIEDAGGGMDDATLKKAPTPFFTTQEPGEGMGLGLFLANAFALGAGGELLLSSTPGVGTRVDLVLPRAGVKLGAHA